MPPSEDTSTPSALAFQLIAALDLYRTDLDALEKRGTEASSECLAALPLGLTVIRLKCAPFAALRACYVEFLIGHSELVFLLGEGGGHADASRGKHGSLLVAAQRRRAGNLMRLALEPLAAHDAANDATLARDVPGEQH
ncbi:hypothetical protein H8N03_00580 [Ramlibacter sp. USB13]|uniref:Uncharacterized protein n=1 Tax=Ramlibacter cellulosilyticus TaxID=2764187 RepID=A0A923MKX6_9BURK|nr:hypothetical protein [Ramlibacter cellulosilyticus]MBC5781415.1 hypothetical protein [Ramlibacter cellulosilyticus]